MPPFDAMPTETRPSRQRPIDLIHLARQTGGSGALERDVLALMARHIEQALVSSERDDVGPASMWAHAIAGAARNLGAFPLAVAASALEAAPDAAERLERFREEARRTLAFIERLQARPAALTPSAQPTTCAA